MKILLANASAYPHIGGVENSLHYMGQELLRAGHEVKIFCLQLSEDEPLRTVHQGIEIVRAPYRQARWPHAQFRLAAAAARLYVPSLLEDFQPDAVWSRSAPIAVGIRRSGYRGKLVHIFCTSSRMDCRGQFLQTRGLPWKKRLVRL